MNIKANEVLKTVKKVFGKYELQTRVHLFIHVSWAEIIQGYYKQIQKEA
jgi:hypothetical protein